ncbi:ranaspumin-like [Rana temporaria]|uniref:ranaspumin-like n=1 Tax=Rana temporaria TaxID=8407 RepID=UPI001AADC9BF|nr:ranaspumin-like [Rana temporaria]
MYRQSYTELKPGNSTMKVILLFALFGLSFCQDGACKNKVSNPEGGNCLALALKETSELGPALAKLACEYYKEEKNKENLEAAFKEVGDVLECVGCKLVDITNNPALTKLLTGVGDAAGDATEGVRELLDSLKLSEPVFKAVCAVGGKLLASECLRNALANNAAGAVTGLKNLYCQLKKSGATDAAANVEELVKRVPCILGELGLSDSVELGKTLDVLGPNTLRDLLAKILELTGNDVAGDLLCSVVGK